MRKRLIWFYNDDCEYCRALEDDVRKFAMSEGADLVRVEAGIIDTETGEPQVPGLMYEDPRVAYHVFIGRFCLDALRYVLNG